MLLFDGVTEEMHRCRFNISNSHLCPEIPRAGLTRKGTQSVSFGASYELFNLHGVTKVFSLAPTADVDDFNELIDTLVTIPPFIDECEIFDSPASRRIPVAMFNDSSDGSPLSSWSKIAKNTLIDTIACLDMSAMGINNFTRDQLQVTNKATLIGLCLDTIGMPPENLALQIAAKGSLVVMPPLLSLKRLGFKHLENCLMPEVDEIYSMIKFALLNPERLSLMAKKGQDLVKKRFLVSNRTELIDWYYGKSVRNELRNSSEASKLDLTARRIDDLIALGELELAERLASELTTSVPWAPGMVLRHSFIKLLQGLPSEAINIISPLVVNRFHLGSEQPDPIQWAMLLLCIFLNRDFESARGQLMLYPTMRRTELDVVRWVLAVALDEKQLSDSYAHSLTSNKKQVQTIHQFGSISVDKVLNIIDVILERCQMSVLSGYLWDQARLQGILRNSHDSNEKVIDQIIA
jgi:hypothetical protein